MSIKSQDEIEEITTPKRLTKSISLLASIASLIFGAICFWLLEVEKYIPIVFMVFSILNTAAFMVYHFTRNLKLTYWLTSILIFTGCFTVAILSGGINSAFLFFLPIVVISGYAMKPKYGNIWLAITFICFSGLFLVSESFINEVNSVSEPTHRIFSFISLMLATIVLGGIYGRYLSTTIYKSIKKTKEISEKNTQNEVLLDEVRRRVGHNLRTINELLTLQTEFTDDSVAKSQLQFSQLRVNALAMIHEMLYQSGDVASINFKTYVSKLVDYLKARFGKNNEDLHVDITASEIYFNLETAIPLGLLTNEILTNSLLHSLKDRAGKISIKLEKLNYPAHILEIYDNGKGFAGHEALGSLEVELIENIALKINGSVERDPDRQGSNFTIIFQEVTNKSSN